MKRAGLLKIVFIAIFLMGFPYIILADDGDGIISRPVIGYSSGDLRDPFNDLFQLAAEKEKKEKERQPVEISQDDTVSVAPMPSLDKFKVQGIIWGGKFPQAIINNKILSVGDSLEGLKIVNIEKVGVTLSFAGKMVSLSAPGSISASEGAKPEGVNKEEK